MEIADRLPMSRQNKVYIFPIANSCDRVGKVKALRIMLERIIFTDTIEKLLRHKI